MAEQIDININARDNASRTFDNLNNKVTALQGKLQKLSSALAGLALGGAILNAVRYADSIQDVATATGIATENVLGFSKAVTLNGGDTEKAQQILLKFVQTLGEASEGGKNAQLAFQDVGISLKDLASLSEQDLLAKTIQGLAEIEDIGKRSKLAVELLGKGAKGINFAGVAAGLTSATVESAKYAEAVRKSAELNDKLDMAISKVKLTILQAIAPFADFINQMDEQKLGQFITAITQVGLALGTLAVISSGLSRSITFIQAVFERFGLTLAAIGTVALTIGASFSSLGKTIKFAFGYIERFIRGVGMFARTNGLVQNLITLFTKLGERLAYIPAPVSNILMVVGALIARLGLLATAVYVVIDAFKQLSEGKGLGDILDGWALKLEQFVTEKMPALAAAINKLNDALGMAPSPMTQQRENARRDFRKQEVADAEKLRQEEKKRGDAARDVNAYYEKQVKLIKEGVENFLRANRETIRAVEFETQLVGKTEDQVEMQRALNDLTLKYGSEINSLIQARDQLDAKEGALIATYNEQIAKLREQLDIDKERMATAVQGLQTAKLLEADRLRQIENTTKAIEAQIERQQQLGNLLVGANDKLKDIEFDAAQMKRSPLEQSIARIQEDARKAALEAGRAFAQAFEDTGDGLTPERAQELANGLDQIAQRYKAIADAQTQNLLASRTWEQGWKEAFDNYMENASNAAKQAGEVFNSITSNMERAIDNFVTTGKFSFGDLARSIIQDLIKIELKAQATAMFKAVAGTAGTFLSSLFGFANGGNPPLNKPSIVGEKGPELFVPRTAGTIIPNHALAGAGGGMMNAPITNNYITNNISAVDAKSVAQLFAENRKTLLGTVQMAQKELPYSNR